MRLTVVRRLRLAVGTGVSLRVTTTYTLRHRDDLNTTNDGGLTQLQRHGTIALFLLPPSKFFPRASRFLLRNGQFFTQLSYLFLHLGGALLALDGFADRIGSAPALLFESRLEHTSDLLRTLYLGASLEEPALELTFR
ncbi:hypothetical protein PC116_g31930 [Phytophthora cactorum]|nr:hypothetical protein PC116_g31930 [Phytophthora cactorum]